MDAIYVRLANNGKIETQIAPCKKEAGSNYTLYVDKGFSGMSLERPELKRLMNDIKKKHIKRVIVYSMDRLTRSSNDIDTIINLFKDYDVELISVKEEANILELYDSVKVASEVQKFINEICDEDASSEIEEI